jgi:hypothetical protein
MDGNNHATYIYSSIATIQKQLNQWTTVKQKWKLFLVKFTVMIFKLQFFYNVIIFFVVPTFSLQNPGMLYSVDW